MSGIRISKVEDPQEEWLAKQRMTSVRFDALVRMFDSGQIQPKGGFLHTPKPLPPQYFKCESSLTMEFVKDADPHTLGSILKKMYAELEEHIHKYENGHL